MAIDYSQFFNPAAVSWGSWSPPARGMVAPQVAGSPMAPAPAGNIGQIPATPSPVSPPAPVAQPRPMAAGMPPNPPAASAVQAAAPAPSPLPNPPANQGGGQNWGSLLQRAALQFQPQQINAPPLQMAQPVGPGNGPWQQAAAALQRPGVPNFAQPRAMFPGMLGGGGPF